LSQMQSRYEGAGNETEEKLAEIWSRLLGIEQIGIHDDFFELGGHSLKAAQLVSQVRKVLGADIKVKEVFEHSTIHQLSGWISGLERKDDTGTGLSPAPYQPYYTA
ncbi:phosphopantetheine-binding protein, partial [Paenibacillus sp. FSL R7-269]|uniref:phosphopantetheine-binding protein n=1 Tax=Paenibacillus sp. FSL R7-269 TaxID=1226755 RepID=UPI0012EB2510